MISTPHYTIHTILQIVGAYQIGYHNRLTGKRYMDQVVVMQNLFHGRTIGHVFDLKGSSRSRYVTVVPPTVTASTVSATPGGDGGAALPADAVRVHLQMLLLYTALVDRTSLHCACCAASM
jgi:hypothetical protein